MCFNKISITILDRIAFCKELLADTMDCLWDIKDEMPQQRYIDFCNSFKDALGMVDVINKAPKLYNLPRDTNYNNALLDEIEEDCFEKRYNFLVVGSGFYKATYLEDEEGWQMEHIEGKPEFRDPYPYEDVVLDEIEHYD